MNGDPSSQSREVALEKLRGYTNQQVAQHLGISLRAVGRKLSIIRRLWQVELDTLDG